MNQIVVLRYATLHIILIVRFTDNRVQEDEMTTDTKFE
jgi:hypothetical protein